MLTEAVIWNFYRICTSTGKSIEGSATLSGLQTYSAKQLLRPTQEQLKHILQIS